jgi:hypothetical protein
MAGDDSPNACPHLFGEGSGMRGNKPVSMDIDQLRGWATFMDRAMIASLVVTVMAVTALSVTTWLSFRFSGALRTHEHAAFDRSSGAIGRHAGQLEQDLSAARERAAALEREIFTARERNAQLEREAASARERAEEFKQAASAASQRAAQAAQDTASVSEKAKTLEIDAAEMQRRVAELARMVGEATTPVPAAPPARATETPQPVENKADESAAATRDASPPSPVVASLRKYAGAKAAIFVLDQVSDAPAVGATILGQLGEAGWSAQTWTWAGVAGIVGVVVLVRDGSEAATNEAASALVDALRSAGLNATKGDWPANWRRFRGVLNGPQTPDPTEAPIRIVIGSGAR